MQEAAVGKLGDPIKLTEEQIDAPIPCSSLCPGGGRGVVMPGSEERASGTRSRRTAIPLRVSFHSCLD